MCAYTAYKTIAVGDPLIAADWNTYIRDNGNEGPVVKSTAAGDMTYATAANTLARIAVGSSGQVLMISAAATPSWQPGLPLSGYFMGGVAVNRHTESGSGITSTDGVASVSFANAYASAPVVTATIRGSTGYDGGGILLETTTTGFTVYTYGGISPSETGFFWIAEGSDV